MLKCVENYRESCIAGKRAGMGGAPRSFSRKGDCEFFEANGAKHCFLGTYGISGAEDTLIPG
jgi:hypothetical protein